MNKSSKLTKVLSVAIAVVMLLGVMACGMFASAADRGEWNASTQYNGGDTVTYQGGIYTAKYWTQGETPDPNNEWGAWRLTGGNPQGGGSTGGGSTGSGVKVPEDGMKNKDEKMPNNQYRAIYYVTQWNWPGTYDPVNQTATADIDTSKLTHINYAFGHIATLDAQGNAFPGYVDVPDPAKLRALVDLRDNPSNPNYNPNLKVLLSIGGWGMDGFCPIASDANKTKIFANSCKQILDEFGLDGIDIDWEYPGTIGDHLDVLTCQHLKLPTWDDANRSANEYGVFVDGMNQIKLFRAVRDVIGWDYLLTIASGVGYDWMCSTSIGELPDYLDFINIMCYDLYGDWEDHSNFNANLYPVPGTASDKEGEATSGKSTGNPLSYDVVCDRLAFRGYPRDIMNIGIPFYGRDRAYNDNGGLGGSVGVGDASWLTFRQVSDLKESGAKVNWDSTCHASYLTGTVNGRTYDVTYDDVKDVQEKMAWIQEKGYGGAMVWEYSQDNAKRELTNAIWDGLNGSGRKQDPPTPSYRFDGTKAGYTTGQDEPAQGDEPVKGTNTIWQSWRNLIPNHPDEVFYGGYSWKRIDISQKWPIPPPYTWMAAHHQGTFGWAPAYAPIFAQEPYTTPDCIQGGNFKVEYPAEWEMVKELPETRFPRNEAGKKKGSINNSVLRISKIQPDKFTAPVKSTINWAVEVTGGSGNYTITNEIWFNGLKFDLDGSVKYEKRRTGGPYPNPTAAARLDADGNLVNKEVQEGDKMNKIEARTTGSGNTRNVSATFNEEGTYYCYTVVKDASGNIASVFSQGVTIGEGGDVLTVTPNPVNLKVGGTQQMSANMPVSEWSSSNENVAKVNSATGLVTAVGEGTCTITALSGDQAFGKRGSATVIVTKDGSGTIDPPTPSGDKMIIMKKDMTVAFVDGAIKPTTDYGNGVFAKCVNNNGTYCLPLRYIGENFGMDVAYVSGQTKVTNKATGEYIVITKGNAFMAKFDKNNQMIASFTAQIAPYTQDGVTMVPLRTVSEALGLGVCYVSSSTTGFGSYVAISTDKNINNDLNKVYAQIGAAHAAGL